MSLGSRVRPPAGRQFPGRFAPWSALQPRGITKALTPASRHFGRQVSPLVSLHLPDIPPPTTRCAPATFYTPVTTCRTCFGLRHEWAGSPSHHAESSSLYCGLPVRFRLLSTPLRGGAVTFGYGGLAYPDTGFHRADVAPSRAHSFPRRRESSKTKTPFI